MSFFYFLYLISYFWGFIPITSFQAVDSVNLFLPVEFVQGSELKNSPDTVSYSEEGLQHHLVKARSLRKNYEYEQAILHAHIAQDIAIKLKQKIAEADANRLLGLMYSETGLFEKSYAFTFKSLEIYQKENNIRGEILAMINIANDFSDISKHDLAKEFYFKSLEKAKQISDTNSIASIFHNLGFMFCELNEYEEAEKYFQEAINMGKLLENNLQLGISYMKWAMILGRQNKDEQAKSYFEEAKNIFDKHNSQIHLARLHLVLSQFYLRRDIEKSLDHAEKSYEISEVINLNTVKIPAVYQFYKIYDYMKDEENSDKYELMYYKLRFDLEEHQDFSKILLLEKVHQWEKEEQNRILENQKRKYQLYFIGFTLLLLMSIAWLILYNRYKIRQKDDFLKQQTLLSQLDLKNKELVINTMSLMKIKSVEQNVIQKLKEISNEKSDFRINHIIRELENSSSKNIWKEFELRFKEVHQSFYESLLSRFPDLTSNEIRLAAFIKLNISTKDIAELTGILPSSVEVARARLRKKLGLTHSDISLYSFLTQLN